jgi:hypothetical protein
MDEKTRFRRFAYGLAATVLVTILAGIFFGSLGVTAGLGLGLLVTLLLGGGVGKKQG